MLALSPFQKASVALFLRTTRLSSAFARVSFLGTAWLGLGTAIATNAFAIGCSGGGDGERLDSSFRSDSANDGPTGAPNGRVSGAEDELGPTEPAPFAHVDIRVTERVESSTSEVLAHFVYSSGSPTQTGASLSRADGVLPAAGRCLAGDNLQAAANAEPAALLEAGAVTLRARPTDPTNPTIVEVSLAPRAFPSVSSLGPGVIYTSRDRQPLLPTGASYEVEVQGGSHVPPMSLKGVSPGQLTSVTLGGIPLRQVPNLVWGNPVDLTWDVGTEVAGGEPDLVYVDITGKDAGQVMLRCAYLDAAGVGTIPWTLALEQGLEANAHATISVHRQRRVATEGADTAGAHGELRFDFELTRDVTFVTSATAL